MTEQDRDASATRPYEILVGLDFSELSERAFEKAIELAQPYEQTELHAVIVASSHGTRMRLPGENETLAPEHARERSREKVAALVAAYREKHGRVPLERVAVYTIAGDPADQLLAIAEALDVDVVVVGTHGRTGVNRLLLGSVAEHVMRRATTGVYVVRPRDFVRGERVPDIEPPLKPGEPHIRPFMHARTYHYVDRASERPAYVMPVT